MEAQSVIDQFVRWSSEYSLNLVVSLLLLTALLLLNRVILPRIEAKVSKSNFKSEAKLKAYHTARVFIGMVFLAILLIVWGVDFSGLLLISTSIITLTGVALFASWSLLSNITSYFLLLFHDAFRRGNFIRVIDGDNYIEGFIAEINLFNVKLITEDREVVVYPNNLILTRPAVINPRARWQGTGKATDKSTVKQTDQD